MKEKSIHLLVFFSFGVSLKTWVETGLISRELLLYKQMVKNGHRVSLMTYGGIEEYQYSDQLDGIEIVPVYQYLKKGSSKWINLIKSLFIPLKMKGILGKADIYKSNQMNGAWVPAFASLLFKRPFVVRCGFEFLRNQLRSESRKVIWLIKAIFCYFLEISAYGLADFIIISNRSDMDFIHRYFPVNKKKIKLIRNFIDTKSFTPLQKTRKIDEKTLLFVGRLEAQKNIENLILAVGQVGCRLIIVGSGSLKFDLQELVQKYSANINFIGTIENSEVVNILRRYRFFILPSWYENNPKTLLEAMSCARVVVGTNVDGIKELIEDGKTGYLSHTDADSLEDTIRKVLSLDDTELKKVAESGRRFIEKECSISTVYKKEMHVYEMLSYKDCLHA
jgi:glycosyltransferase involved in cell wall biosynthesis